MRRKKGDRLRRRDLVDQLAAVRAELGETQRLAGVGTWVWDLAGGRITWSEELCRLVGHPATHTEFSLEELLGSVPAGDRDTAVERARSLPAQAQPFRVDQPFLRPDGTAITLEVRGEFDTDGAGAPVQARGTARDVTEERDRERREAEQRARRERESLMRLLARVSVLGTATGTRERVLDANDEFLRITGHSREELEAGTLTWARLIHPEFLSGRPPAPRAYPARQVIPPTEDMLVRKDGSTIPVLAGGVVTSFDPVQWIVFLHDQSEWRRTEAELAASERRNRSLVDDEREARTEAEEGAERAWRLGRITAALSRALTEDDLADALAGEVLPALGGDAFSITLLEGAPLEGTRPGNGRVRLLRAVGFGPGAQSRLTGKDVDSGPVREVLDGGRPIFLGSAGEHAGRYPGVTDVWSEVKAEAQAHLPLIADGDVVGALHLGFPRRRAFGEAERVFLTTVAALAAQALERTRLMQAERSSREDAELAARRLRQVQSISDIALSRLPIEELVDALRSRIQAILDVDLVRIYVLDEDRMHLRLAGGLGDAAGPGIRVPLGSGLTGRIGALRRPLVMSDAASIEPADPMLADVASLAGVPLTMGERLVGVLHVSTYAPREFTGDDVDLLELAAERIAVALERSRTFETQRRMARTLQAALLPPSLPSIPGVALSARYVAAGEGTDVGGDFYDVFPLAGGAWLAIVGDVCGRGPEAAAMTGLARHSVRAVAQESEQPAGILARLNVILGDEAGDERFATAVCARMEPRPEGMRLTVASGGHCRPALVRADGKTEMVDVRGTLLGPFPSIDCQEVIIDLGPGDSVLLYTDGVVESSGHDGQFGEDRLVDLLSANAGLASGELAGLVEEAVWAHTGGGPTDDLALLVLQVPPGVPAGVDVRFDRSLPLGERAPRVARRAVDVVLGKLLSPDTLDAARLAVSELVTNAVIHGLDRVDGPHLRILTGNGMVRLEVRNRSLRFTFPVRPASPMAESGRGLDVVRAVATAAGIEEEGPMINVWCTFETVDDTVAG